MIRKNCYRLFFVVVATLFFLVVSGCEQVAVPARGERFTPCQTVLPLGTRYMDFAGYKDCIVLENAKTRVILGPHCGGRVLEYSRRGVSAIQLDPRQAGWIMTPGKKPISPAGGRWDIGPERKVPPHPVLWSGRWTGEILGPRKARMTSQPDPQSGVQLIRIFELDAQTSYLRCTQTIKNISSETKEYSHWSRTFAPSGGTFLLPVTKRSRFPRKYIRHEPKARIAYWPKDKNVREQDGFLIVTPYPEHPELGFDSLAGWFAYLTPDNLLFVKKFPVYPDRVYNELVAVTAVIYYGRTFCELEPIGPRERLQPGASASFTEEWWLLDYPQAKTPIDLEKFRGIIQENTSVSPKSLSSRSTR